MSRYNITLGDLYVAYRKAKVEAFYENTHYRALHPAFDHVTLVAGGGKSECLALVRALEEPLRLLSSKLNAIALVDKDYSSTNKDQTNNNDTLFVASFLAIRSAHRSGILSSGKMM